jgi:hypothetical protein
MKLLFKIFLKFGSDDDGFAIPIVMALGLLMTFIGLLGVFKSNEEEITAVSQRNRAKALAAAETAVNSYRLILDRNKQLALYDQFASTTTTAGWRTTTIPLCDNATSIGSAINNHNFQAINGNVRFGEYRLISYDYNRNPNDILSSFGEGTLIVEGKAGQATARLRVDIPVQPTTAQRNLVPILWLNNQTANNFSNIQLGNTGNTGDLLLSVGNQRNVSGTSACNANVPEGTGFSSGTTFNSPNNQSVIIEPIPIPSIISTPPDANSVTVASADLNTRLPTYQSTPNNAILPSSFPSNATEANATIANAKGVDPDNTYYYKVNGNLDINRLNLSIQNGTKVVLFVNGNLTFNSSSGNIALLPVTGSTNTSAFLEIYVSGNRTITFSGNNRIEIRGLIHAPNSTVVVQDNPTIIVAGAIWANRLTGATSNTNRMTIFADTYTSSSASNIPAYVNYSMTDNILIPTISPPDQWVMQEIR